jgi:type II secretory pathway pseudopilin PulG
VRVGRAAGFSLLEAVFVTLLLGVAMLLLAGIFREYTRILTQSKAHDTYTEAVTRISQLIRNDAQSAFRIESPLPNGTASSLVLNKLRPSNPRFSAPRTWTRYPSSLTTRVIYSRQAGHLTRQSTPGTTERLLPDVQELSCQMRGSRSLSVRMTFKVGRQTRTVESLSYLPLERLAP